MKKNEEYIVDIIDNGYEGEGIAKVDNFIIFIPNGIKGEKVKIVIVKVTSSYAYGKILEIIEKSEDRVEDIDCSTYKRCGGCDLRHMNYNKTLELKKNTVQNLVNKTLKNKVEVKDTMGMENPFNYRNKAQYPVGIDKDYNPIIGVFANRTHEVIEIKQCMIQNKQSEEIAKFICEFAKQNNISVYNEETRKGLLRHIVIKVGIKTNEIMCILVINGKNIPSMLETFITKKHETIPKIKNPINNDIGSFSLSFL